MITKKDVKKMLKKDISKGRLIAVVDDEQASIDLTEIVLGRHGFKVKGFTQAAAFFNFLKVSRPDLVILDLTMPDMNGFEICKMLKEDPKFAAVPVIMVTGSSEDSNKVQGLNYGADDYIVKPYSAEELNARINAILRRCVTPDKNRKISIDGIVIDPAKHEVSVNGKRLDLTPAEFQILEYLCSRVSHVLTRSQILERLWGDEKVVVDRTIDVHIRHLREKLGGTGKIIKNVRGIGYKIEL